MNRAFLVFLLMFTLAACGEQYEKPADAIDCGSQFINAIFKGNFKRARQLMVQDEANMDLLNGRLAKDFRSRNSLEKDQLRNSSININEIDNVSDTVTIINFKNSYDGKSAVLKVVNRNGEWQTDLKYTFSGNF